MQKPELEHDVDQDDAEELVVQQLPLSLSGAGCGSSEVRAGTAAR